SLGRDEQHGPIVERFERTRQWGGDNQPQKGGQDEGGKDVEAPAKPAAPTASLCRKKLRLRFLWKRRKRIGQYFDVSSAALPDAVTRTLVLRHRSLPGATPLASALLYTSKTVSGEYPVVDEPCFKAKSMRN